LSIVETIAKTDRALRPVMTRLPGHMATRVYSRGREIFLRRFVRERPAMPFIPDEYGVELWGLRFRVPLFNAAGIFKNGEGYEVCALQGAGAYLAGTTTSRPRMGNTRKGIDHPFTPYPHSGAASNWMGLPNRGHAVVAKRLSGIEKVSGCPLGASVSADPELKGLDALGSLAEGMHMYISAGVDFLELNESCPNVPSHAHQPRPDELDKDLLERLEYVSDTVVRRSGRGSERPVPVIIKVSNDIQTNLLPALIDVLLDLGFAGINIGNTSTAYATHEAQIDNRDLAAYRRFTGTFGGGLSGKVVKGASIQACTVAQNHVTACGAENFHVIRTGGIEQFADVCATRGAGVHLAQWYTGYFEQFAHNGHEVYARMFSEQNLTAWNAAL
jgi:dihydroorotate dehydrogenase